jgi:hypothetical protein
MMLIAETRLGRVIFSDVKVKLFADRWWRREEGDGLVRRVTVEALTASAVGLGCNQFGAPCDARGGHDRRGGS